MKNHQILILFIAFHLFAISSNGQTEYKKPQNNMATPINNNTVATGHFEIDKNIPSGLNNDANYSLSHVTLNHSLNIKLGSKDAIRFSAVVWDSKGHFVEWKPTETKSNYNADIDISTLTDGGYFVYIFSSNSLSPLAYIPFQ